MKKKFPWKVLSSTVLVTCLSLSSIGSTISTTHAVEIQQNEEAAVASFSFDGNVLNEGSAAQPEVVGDVKYTEGRIKQALHFESTSQATAPYIDLGDTDELKFGEDQDFSIAFWLKSPGVNADPAIISNKNWASGGNTGWFVGMNGGSLVWNYSTSESNRLDKWITVGDNVWHHIAISHDRDGSAKIYKDGQLEAEVDISQTEGTIDTDFTTKIGVDGKGTLWGNHFNAMLDDLHIFRDAISDEDVQRLYENAPAIALEDIRLDQEEVTLNIGAKAYINVAIEPSNASNQSYTVESSDPTVATVTEENDSLIVEAKGVGNADITVSTTDGNHVAVSSVSVENSKDVNGDGLLTKEDMKLVSKLAGAKEGGKKWDNSKIADLNLDGRVNGKDVQVIQKALKEHNGFQYKHVFVIGLDGAGNFVKNANAPRLKQFFADGAYTYEAKTEDNSSSAPAWGAMLHGVGYDIHQEHNGTLGDPFAENVSHPSFLKLLKQERPAANTAAMMDWNPIYHGLIERSAETYFDTAGDDVITERIVEYIKTKGEETPLMFIQLSDLDYVGHANQYESEKYYKQYEKTDENVGKILDAIEDAGLMEDSLIVMSTDHGGHGYTHGTLDPKDTTIFWAAKGKSIEPGTVITDHVDVKDTAAVVAKALRLDAPEAWEAKVPEGLFEEGKGLGK
ncbi:sulfatase-like hydrolase/transferase [Bacillaceae bacterium SIJ1]|uniref:LamG-like jellyroll fold domain-containing protein n=1 Tax=Litoribacterium kuwaitense TaxID=1398745 RepID=UPI0013E9FF57|nr:LamG-like jellyroll fold domain-containing protein [Litoribacterium kuwaitense]NGP44048.1 sulfatase-like hydrolase/transferase [Litoribacterium kuwaitense]